MEVFTIDPITGLVAVFILIALNGIFVAGELLKRPAIKLEVLPDLGGDLDEERDLLLRRGMLA